MAVLALALALTAAAAVGIVGAVIPDSCYGSLGCFSNGAPWTTLLRPIPPPKSPEFLDTRYYLFTRNAPDRFDVSQPSDGVYSVDGSDFDGSRPTIFVVHGFTGSGTDSLTNSLKDAAIAKSDANVIVVDWAKGASDSTYFNCASNTRVVAATTAQLVRYLIAEKGASLAKVHFIGFSMGAHVSAYVGKAIANIGRITALDPAQSVFEAYDKTVRLDVGDAVYVDVIHTDARPLITFGRGYVNPGGHVDFYVNGGWNQPECELKMPAFTSLADFGNAAIGVLYDYFTCRHFRSVELFVTTSTRPNCRFWGHKVNSVQRALILATGDWASMFWRAPCARTTCSEMGFDSIHYPGRGSFDVATSKTEPFCLPDSQADAIMAPFYIP